MSQGRPIRQAGQAGGFSEWYASLPPVTKYHGTACLVTAAAASFNVLNPALLYFDWRLLKHLQVWRLVTNFIFLGGFGMKFFFEMLWLATYGLQLEKSTAFANNTADYVWMYLVGMGTMLVLSLVPLFSFPFYGSSLVFMVLYVWSRYFATQPVSIMGLFKVEAKFLPFVLLAMSMMSGGSGYVDMCGILTGHLWYYFRELEPARSGQRLLPTPLWLKRGVFQVGLGTVPVREVVTNHPSDVGFRAFRGRGRRLGD